MGRFIKYDPRKFNMESAAELKPEFKDKVNLVTPSEWAGCEIERELTRFSRRNNHKPE